MSRVNLFVKTMKDKGFTLALAESVTCGMATDKLAAYKGTSDMLQGSVVCYSPEVKCRLLRVPKKLIDHYSCESMQVTEAMLKGLIRIFTADIYAAITGLASDGGSETKNKPVGTIFFCVKYGRYVFRQKKVYRGTPLQIRKKACEGLYEMILSKLK